MEKRAATQQQQHNQSPAAALAMANTKIKPGGSNNQPPALDKTEAPARSRNTGSGIKKSNSQGNVNATGASASFSENDTFNKYYNKELRVSKDEIPIVLGELNDSAIAFIKREQWDKALNLLQKAYGIMDVVDFSLCRRDKFNLFILFHNMALCYQKLQMLEECAQCIEQALDYMPADQFSLEERSISNRMRKLHLTCKLKLQYCAILSQVHRHKDALEQSREGVRISHHLINDMKQLCEFYIKREDIEQSYGASTTNAEQSKASKCDSISRNNNALAPQGIDTEMTYNSYRSQRRAKHLANGSRNRSFCQFLSQQEGYNSEALLFQGNNNGNPMRQLQNNNFIGSASKNIYGGVLNESASGASHNLSQFYSLNFLEESMSYLERTARKLNPILAEVKKRMVTEKAIGREYSIASNKVSKKNKVQTLDSVHEELADGPDNNQSDEKKQQQVADMKNILGYLNQGEWTQTLSIGSIMQLQPFSLKDLLEQGKNELELTRDSFIQKVSLLAVAYFCYSTEIRFILQMKEDPNYDPLIKHKESEFWHAKSLEMACTFLPSECPLLNHINLSYQKHFAPVKQTIHEEEAVTDDLKVVKPLNGIDNPKFQPIIRQLSGLQVAITPYQMTPLNQITNQFLSQMVNFNEYQEQQTNHQGSIKSQIGNVPAGHVTSVDNSLQHQQQFPLHTKSKSGDLTAVPAQANASSHKRMTTADHGLLVNKLETMSKYISQAAGDRNETKQQLTGVNNTLISANGAQVSDMAEGEDDLLKFEKLLDKLIKENKIDKLELLKKIQLKDGAAGSASNGNSSITKNLLEEHQSSQSNDILLDDQIMAEQDSCQLQDDEELIAMEPQHQPASNNLFKLRNPESERPKTSNGNQRNASTNEEKMSQIERINQYHKQVEEKKKSQAARPLSGGLQQKIKSESQKSRVNKINNAHNMSMYEKFGSGMALGGSPERPQQQQTTYINSGKVNTHSQFITTTQNQPVEVKSSLHKQNPVVGHHIQQQQQKISYINTQQQNNSASMPSSQQLQKNVLPNQSAPIEKKAEGNVQAYDELKKRLLSEYKKLTSGKKTFDEQVREKYKNLKQRAVSGKKIQSTHQIPNPTIPQPQNASSGQQQAVAYQPTQLSPRHHLNVYKPTFIINNSFAGEGGSQQQIAASKEIEILDEISKKYRPSSKQGTSYPIVGGNQPVIPSGRSSSIGNCMDATPGQLISQQQSSQKQVASSTAFHHERQNVNPFNNQPLLNNQQILGMLINQDKKSGGSQSNSIGNPNTSKKNIKSHHQSQHSQHAQDMAYAKQYMVVNEKIGHSNNMILGISGTNGSIQQKPSQPQMKAINGYSTQQQFNQFNQLQQHHQQLQAQQYPLGGPNISGGVIGLPYKMNNQVDQQQQQTQHQIASVGAAAQSHQKRSGSQIQMLISQPLQNTSTSSTVNNKPHPSHSQAQYEKLKKKLANY